LGRIEPVDYRLANDQNRREAAVQEVLGIGPLDAMKHTIAERSLWNAS
jgi:hypothetical protein